MIEKIPEAEGYILCDNDEVKKGILEYVRFLDENIRFLESCKQSSELNDIVENITDDGWRNAGYAAPNNFLACKGK